MGANYVYLLTVTAKLFPPWNGTIYFPQIPQKIKEKFSKKRNQMEVEPVPAGASFGQINPICLFLPAIIYSRWFFAMLMMFEVFIVNACLSSRNIRK